MYTRFALTLYLFTITVLFYSSVMLIFKVSAVILLTFNLFQIIRNPFPHPDYLALSYDGTNWILQTNKDSLIYENACVLVNSGLFILLELNIAKQKKMIVIFSDQFSNDDKRLIRITEKNHHK